MTISSFLIIFSLLFGFVFQINIPEKSGIFDFQSLDLFVLLIILAVPLLIYGYTRYGGYLYWKDVAEYIPVEKDEESKGKKGTKRNKSSKHRKKPKKK